MLHLLQLERDLNVAYIGPHIDEGPLPTIFYFALSAEESLNLDPYNQPALYLSKQNIRVFSMSLPEHGPGLNAVDAMSAWAKTFEEGHDPLAVFINQTLFIIDTLIQRGYVLPEKIGVMGLSRGALVAGHVAARKNTIQTFLGFAPLTELTFIKEFQNLSNFSSIKKWNLSSQISLLSNRTIRFYIGNRDLRVGTIPCFHLVEYLANTAYEQGIRSPKIELILSPSIGYLGHGTSKEIFESGAHWLENNL